MAKICYEQKRFRPATLALITTADAIVEEYASQGFDLTLRQLYYQFVARGLLENTERSYRNLGAAISNARIAGLIDWNRIVDRTRGIRELAHWREPKQILESCAHQYRIDKWLTQRVRPEVWIEKDALVGVLASVCRMLDVAYFSCRGYASQSSLWRAAQRLKSYETSGQRTVIYHLGDHDPSGLDMTRDISERLRIFGSSTEVHRIALNMDQVQAMKPPPNPAKLSDARASDYVRRYGSESWELDALDPFEIERLVRQSVLSVRDEMEWGRAEQVESVEREELILVSEAWHDVVAWTRNRETREDRGDDEVEWFCHWCGVPTTCTRNDRESGEKVWCGKCQHKTGNEEDS